MIDIQTLLAELPRAEFLARYYHRLPYAAAGSAAAVCPLGGWEALVEILQRPEADVMVVRSGERFAGPLPTSAEAAQALLNEGFTILVRHAERHHGGLKDLADAFVRDLCAPVNIHLYATPAGHHGFGWHYDAEDVFIMQTAGSKLYSLRKNTVHPWPLVETIPADMRYPSEIMPLMRVELHAGDWLYIPCGYWHKAEASATSADPTGSGRPGTAAAAEAAVSIALGAMSAAAIQVFDFLRPELLKSLLWRQRLPMSGVDSAQPGEQADASELAVLFAQLADDLAQRLHDPRTVERFKQSLNPTRRQAEPGTG